MLLHNTDIPSRWSRFRPKGYIAINILPPGLKVIYADASELDDVLCQPTTSGAFIWDSILESLDHSVWAAKLNRPMINEPSK
jgi:hypothetical protein